MSAEALTQAQDAVFSARYSVGEVAKIIGLPTSTLRFYEKEGLLPPIPRTPNGRRRYTIAHLESLRFIECMKQTGLPLKDISEIIKLSQEGDATISRRLEIMRTQRDAIRAQLAELQQHLAALEFKTWYYETAQQAGSCAAPEELIAAGKVQKPNALQAFPTE